MQLDDKDLLKNKLSRKVSAQNRSRKKLTEHADETIEKGVQSNAPFARRIEKKEWIRLLDTAFSWVLYGFVFLVPIFFLPFTNDVLELNKQLLLVFGTLILALLSCIRACIAKEVSVKLSSAYAGIAIVLAVWLAASILSHYPYNSFLGIERQESISFVTILSLSLFTILFAHAEKRLIFFALCSLVASLALASLIGIAQLFGIGSTSPLGSIEVWGPASVLGMLLSVGLFGTVSLLDGAQKLRGSTFLAISISIQLATLAIFDDWRLWTVAIAGLAVGLCILFWKLQDERLHLWVIVPTALVVLSALGIVIHLRVVQLPLSVQPTWTTSANLAWQTIAHSPLFGFGPGTFMESYTRFRPVSINSVNYLNLWSARFDQASAVAFTATAAVGAIGILAIFALLFLLIRKIILFLKSASLGEELLLMLSFCMALAGILVLSLMKPANMSLVFIEAIVVGGALALIPKTSVRFASEQSNQFLILSSTLVSLTGAALLFMLIVFSNRYGGDLAFAKVLSLDRSLSERTRSGAAVTPDDIDAVSAKIQEAIRVNPSVDLYYRTLSQALLTKATTLMQNGTQDIATVQVITEQVIATAKKAVDINPNDVRNLENLSAIYTSLSVFTGGADSFAVDAFKKTAALDPSNPSIPLAAAKLHLQLADTYRKRAATEKNSTSSPNMVLAVKAALSAEQAANDALKLKGDLPAAHYYLAIAKSQTGNNKEAIELLTRAAQENAALIANQAADALLFGQLATSFAALGEKQKAIDTVRVALTLVPDDQQSLWLYGNLLADAEKKDEAIAILGKLLEKNPKNEGVIKRLQELKGIAKEPAPDSPPSSSATSTDELQTDTVK